MAKIKLNKGHYKEALDRCISVSKIIREVVLTHPAIEQDEQASHLIAGAISEVDAVAQLVIQQAINNDGRLHDRAFWLLEMIIELLLEHPVISKDRKGEKLAKKVSDDLWKLYKYLGTKEPQL